MGEKKSVLILSATAGAGHRRAAEALAAAACEFEPRLAVRHEDILDFTAPVFKKLYSEVYYSIVSRSPEFWGFLYNSTDRRKAPHARSAVMKLFDHFNYQKYLRALDRLKPDAVLCTHFLPYAAITDELRRPSWAIPFYAVPTDYYVHALWLDPSIGRYYVPSDEAGWMLEAHGIPSSQIAATGIPVMPSFAGKESAQSARRSLGLRPDAFTVMILSGGYGVGPASGGIDELVPSLSTFLGSFTPRPFQLIVVCGKNPGLFQTLKQVRPPENVSLKLYQYVDSIDKLMDASDILITKAGGLTVSEALAKHLPMVIFQPLPGQEGRNAEYVLEQGAGLSAWSFPSLHFKLKGLIERPARLAGLRAAARSIAHPHAARRIIADLLKRLEGKERA